MSFIYSPIIVPILSNRQHSDLTLAFSLLQKPHDNQIFVELKWYVWQESQVHICFQHPFLPQVMWILICWNCHFYPITPLLPYLWIVTFLNRTCVPNGAIYKSKNCTFTLHRKCIVFLAMKINSALYSFLHKSDHSTVTHVDWLCCPVLISQ